MKQNGFRNVEIINFDFLHPAIPRWMLPGMEKIALMVEKIPVIRSISGSLIIKASK